MCSLIKDDNLYRRWSSQVTLQSHERGLFSPWVAEVARRNPEALVTLNQMDSDEERVLFCTTLTMVDHCKVEPVYKRKDLEVARQKRTEGNAAFQKKWYRQAALLYSVSAVKAPGGPAGDETLAYAVANRHRIRSRQKGRQRSSILIGGRNGLNSMPY